MPEQVESALRIVLTGQQRDGTIKNMLEKDGHEVIFIEAEEPLPDESTNFNFKHLRQGINYAQQNGFDLVIGLDEPAGKMSIAVRKEPKGAFVLLNIHQLAAILTDHWIQSEEDFKFIFLKSIHISDMLETIAIKSGQKCISSIIEPGTLINYAKDLLEEQPGCRIIGISENQEFYDSEQNFPDIIKNIVRLENELRDEDKTLFDYLISLYNQYGFYKEKTFVVDIVSGRQKKHMLHTMQNIRNNPGILEGRIPLSRITDYFKGVSYNLLTQKRIQLSGPKTNILKIESGINTSVTMKPSVDKFYYYVSIMESKISRETYQEENRMIDQRMLKLIEIINAL